MAFETLAMARGEEDADGMRSALSALAAASESDAERANAIAQIEALGGWEKLMEELKKYGIFLVEKTVS